MTQGDALDILKTGANVFLTGEPGSGKTHTLNAYVAWLRSHGIEPSITASTGIAATHISGMTIHAWSGIGILDSLTPYDLDRIVNKEHVVRRIQKTKVLIIDEVSMLSGGVLDMVDQVAREARHDDRPMGGMQVVLSGDFFQLPPIQKVGRPASFAFDSRAWKTLAPVVCYLEEQHRQEDGKFLSLLSAIRAGTFDHTHASLILARSGDGDELDDDTPRLFTHNADVDRINDERLAKLPGKSHVYRMKSDGSSVLAESLKRGCLSPETLTLKEGAVVMCTKNNPIAGYVNGTLGTVIGFQAGTNDPIIETRDLRTLTISTNEWAVEENGKVRAKITQIPLRLAWAITVHKSQGMSMDAAAMDLSRTFEYGQGYVALSRVRELEGLTLLGWNEQAAMVHPEVAKLDADLIETSAAAAIAFARLREEKELDAMHARFITASGGSMEILEPGEVIAKVSTYDATLALAKEKKTVYEIASERGLTLGTIADHLEKLVKSDRLRAGEVAPILPEKVTENLEAIHAVFKKTGPERLAPAYGKLKAAYTFDELKLARILYKG